MSGLLFASLGAILFSGKAIVVKLTYRYGIDAVTIIMYRMLFALPLFAAMGWWGSRGKAPLPGRDWAHVVGLGFLGYYVAITLNLMGLEHVTASLERLIGYLNPTLVMLLCWLLFRKPVRRMHLVGIAISYCGVFIAFGQELIQMGASVTWGAGLTLASAITYSCYLVYSGHLVQRLGSLRLVGMATSVAAVLCILQFLVLRPLDVALSVAPEVIWLSILNATLCTALPALMLMMGIERVGPAMTAQAGMIGPLSTLAMGVLILNEPLTSWLVAGTVLVIAGIYVFSRGAGTPAR